jgi:CRISPR-associated RAMP protein (TIGR02581 family)
MDEHKQYECKVKITGTLTFTTAFHIGSGKEGELATDMGILKGTDGTPILPGSTLKGSLRSLCERLAPYLHFNTCLLDTGLSGVRCVSDEKVRRRVLDDLEGSKKEPTEKEKVKTFYQNTCGICRLFGSPVQASRIFFSDGILEDWARVMQIRDGVCIDRDTETARDRAKYDFEVAPPGAAFFVSIELENPAKNELALIAAALAEWENGFRLGGFTSRGLGQVKLEKTKVEQVDYGSPEQLRTYLLERKMTPVDGLLENCLKEILNQKGGTHAKETH